MQSVIDIAAPVFLLGLLGYLAARLGWFPEEAAAGLARFVFDFAVPLMLLRVMAQAKLPSAFPWGLLASFYVPAALLYLLGMLLCGTLFGRDLAERTVGGFSGSFGNSVLLGLPLALLTFGEQGMLPYFILLSVHGLGYLTVSTLLLEYARHRDQPLARLARGVARGLVTNPIILGLAAGLALNAAGLALPRVAEQVLRYMELAVTPCSLFALGASLAQCRIAGRLPEPLLLAGIKLLLMPTLVWLLAVHVLRLPQSSSQSAILLAAQPTGVNVYLLAARYAAARELATTTVFLSTVLSLVTVSLVVYLLHAVG